jgi:hypothetical protein
MTIKFEVLSRLISNLSESGYGFARTPGDTLLRNLRSRRSSAVSCQLMLTEGLFSFKEIKVINGRIIYLSFMGEEG